MVAKTNVLQSAAAADFSTVPLQLPPRLDHARLRIQLGLMALDMSMLALAGVFASLLWVGKPTDPHSQGILMAMPVLQVLIGINGGAYSTEILSSARRGAARALRCAFMAALAVIFAAFFLKVGEQISRVVLLLDVVFGAIMLVVGRIVAHRRVARRYGMSLYNEILILDRCTHPAPPDMFVLDAAEFGLRCDMRDPLMLDRIGRALAPVDRVVIACRAEHRREWAMVMKGANIHAEIISAELTELGPLGTGHLGSGSTVVVATGSLNLRQRIAKRALDVSLAVLALIALAPILAVIAIAIKFDSPGSVLFVQDRVGRGNRLFGIYKFRSMRAEKSDRAGNRSASRGDDRITRVGRIIRATSIDELPQLINILKGDMSFVGPRPHALGSLAGDLLFWEVDERYWHRHACKPGLTGLAQVRGFRGATHKESDLTNRLQADLEYITGWTLWRDISILLATLRVVVHRNAY